jgi:hypothetical protein
MTPPCDYSHLAEHGDTPPCWGEVSLVESIEMSSGDPVVIQACQGHKGISTHGFYLEEGAPPPVEDPTDPEVRALSDLWDLSGDLCTTS